jgi:hypothetical protein
MLNRRVERELVLRLASILWQLRRATAMETGLFEIQAEHLNAIPHQLLAGSREVIRETGPQGCSANGAEHNGPHQPAALAESQIKADP